MFPEMIPFIVQVSTSMLQPILYVISDKLALDFLFGGAVTKNNLTEYAVDKFADRYVDSIDSLNRAIMFSAAFVPIALLPTGSGITIPLVGYEISKEN
jgi:hypothetical protein